MITCSHYNNHLLIDSSHFPTIATENIKAGNFIMEDLSSEALLALADSHFVDENYDEAVEAYAAALALFRDTEVALQIRALSHRSSAFFKLQRYQEAFDDAQNSLMLLSAEKPSGLRPGEGEICHFRAGRAAFELKEYKHSKTLLEKAAELATLNKRQANKETYENLLHKCNAQLFPPDIESEKSVSRNSPQAAIEEPTSKRLTSPTANTGVPKYQYYQSDKVMTISILEAGVQQEDLTVRFRRKNLFVALRKNGTNFTIIAGNLFAEIDVEKSKVVFKDEKVLVKLRKVEHFEWHELMGKGDDNNDSAEAKTNDPKPKNVDSDETGNPKPIPTVPKDDTKARPYASHRDWDAIEKNIADEEKNEKPEGDEAMNKLFKQIYSNASDDTRRAMVKSFQTSGGTVLSTNWDEVKEKDYEKERTGKTRKYD